MDNIFKKFDTEKLQGEPKPKLESTKTTEELAEEAFLHNITSEALNHKFLSLCSKYINYNSTGYLGNNDF